MRDVPGLSEEVAVLQIICCRFDSFQVELDVSTFWVYETKRRLRSTFCKNFCSSIGLYVVDDSAYEILKPIDSVRACQVPRSIKSFQVSLKT